MQVGASLHLGFPITGYMAGSRKKLVPWPISKYWILSGGFIDYSVISDSGSSVISVPEDFRLSGFIPRTLGNLSKLRVLDLSMNELSGGIPHELGKLSNLEVLDLRSNKLSGEIPSEMGNLRKLNTLYLSDSYFWTNSWTGCVPAALREQLDPEHSAFGDLPFCADDGQ